MAELQPSRSASDGPFSPGSVFLDKYEVRSLLGKGAHAFVYECFDPFLQRLVAVKVIKTPLEVGRNLAGRAQAEAQVLSRLDHPHLVKVIDGGVKDGLVYIVMERLDGRPLRHVLMQHGRLTLAEALRVCIQVANGMEVAHDAGVIHRDLKPENIMVTPGNVAKVLDFGVAKVLGAGRQTTQRDLLQGTVLYMSPEQLQGFGVTPQSDVYALGTILYECLYCHPLALRGLPSNKEVVWMQVKEIAPRLEELDKQIPRHVGKLVRRAIAKAPEQRFRSMRAFREAAAEALRRLVEEERAGKVVLTYRELSGAPAGDAGKQSRASSLAPVVVGGEPEPLSAVQSSDTLPPRPVVPPMTAPRRPAARLLGATTAGRLSRTARAGLIAGIVVGAAIVVGAVNLRPTPSRGAASPKAELGEAMDARLLGAAVPESQAPAQSKPVVSLMNTDSTPRPAEPENTAAAPPTASALPSGVGPTTRGATGGTRAAGSTSSSIHSRTAPAPSSSPPQSRRETIF
ncbi:MAG TPA: protein kinase [Polyangiaceae bacterium]|nr:protein kinase [Polyangiaceae bacterium]